MRLSQILFIALTVTSACCHAQGNKTTQKNVAVTNFSNYTSGQEFCDKQLSNDPSIQACMPIYNQNTYAFINLKTKENPPFQGVAPGTVFAVNYYHETDSFNIIVNNAIANKVIYSGPVYDMLGIVCDYTSCKPWK
ncbi:MAG: hypothetical protein ACPGUD_04950 [Parashewanella sp.]